MHPRAMLLRRLCLAGVLLAVGARASAQLAANSPFLPSAASGAAAPTQNAPLEFRGFIEAADGVPQYRIYDPARKSGVWAKLNERNPDLGVVVKQYDPEHNTVTVDAEGRTLTLEERKPKIVSSGSAAAVVAPMPANMNQAVVQTVTTNPTPADEQKRLEAVAQEVARRRALREQATNQLNQGVPPVQLPPVQNQNNVGGRRGGPVPGRQSR